MTLGRPCLNRRKTRLILLRERSGAQKTTRTVCNLGRGLPSDQRDLSSQSPERPINRPRNNCPRQLNISIHLFGLTSALPQCCSNRPARLLGAYASGVQWKETFARGAQNQLATLCSSSPDNLFADRRFQRSHDTVGDLVPSDARNSSADIVLQALSANIEEASQGHLQPSHISVLIES